MVNLIFKRSREEFLTSQKEEYAAAVADNTVHDFLDLVYSRYARRFPIELPLDEDPAPEVLAAVDDNAPDPEPVSIPKDLSEEEWLAEEKRMQERQALIRKRKKQLAHWFSYRYMKEQHIDPRSSDPANPFSTVLFSLTGKSSRDKPRQKSAVNCWSKSKEAAELITILVRKACIKESVRPQQAVAIWNRVAREEYSKLDDATKSLWEQKAKDDHAADVAEWKAMNEGEISTSSEARQRCIEGLVRFSQPILDAMSQATGFKVSLFAGGPEPADNGRLNIISLHSGTTNGEDPLNFGQSERAGIVQYVLPLFSKFLRKCYTPEECRSRALAVVNDLVTLSEVNLDALGGSVDEASLLPPPISSGGDDAELAPPGPSPPDANTNIPAPESTPRRTSPVLSSPLGSHPVTPLGSPFHSPTRRDTAMSDVVTPSTSPVGDLLGTHPSRSPSPVAASQPPSTAVATPSHTAEELSRSPATNSDFPAPAQHTSARKRRAKPLQIDHPTPKRGRSAASHAASVASAASATTTTAPSIDSAASATTTPAPSFASAASAVTTPAASAASTASAPPASEPIGVSTTNPLPPRTPVNHEGTLTSEAVVQLRESQKWFGNAFAMFTSDPDMDEAWTRLISAWAAFEIKFASKPAGQLPATGRPTAIGDWIARARRPAWRPVIAESKHYAAAHVEWWTNLQPEWRTSEQWVATPGDGDCEGLQVRGPNGLVSVVASLFFWADAVKAAGKKSKKWSEVVADTTDAFEHFLSCD